MKHIICFGITVVLLQQAVWARPVSYPSGTTFMQMNDTDRSSLHLHYSPSIRYSVGYKGEYWQDDDWQFHGVQLNYLAKRWNRPASQANVYFKSGFGLAHFESVPEDDSNTAGFTGISMDWENRRYFTQYENRYTDAGGEENFFMQKARLGIAPYIGDYGDLHTWIMLQVDHNPKKTDAVVNTALVRLFKSDYLAELGVNEDGDALFNFVVRF